MARILTGIQSSGVPHLGNILGAMQPAIQLSKETGNNCIYFIADLHSLTSLKDAEVRKHNIYSTLAAWIALGFDYKNNILFKQSDNAVVTELTWYLSCFTPFPMLNNAHSFKDKSDNLSDVNAGLFVYPVLMTADILLYDVNIVPVGKDQQQHLEMARDIAKAFNNQYGNLLVVPEARISQDVMTIPGTDGRKMSKSYGNTINIFLNEKELKKQVMSIVTDDTPLELPKNPTTCNVFALYKLIATNEQTQALRAKYEAGNYGYGHAKLELLELLVNKFASERLTFQTLMNNTAELDAIAAIGANKAKEISSVVLAKVRQALGF
jgi:tryptophanyl-tRNA synthetase